MITITILLLIIIIRNRSFISLCIPVVCNSPWSGGSRAGFIIVTYYPPWKSLQLIEMDLWVTLRLLTHHTPPSLCSRVKVTSPFQWKILREINAQMWMNIHRQARENRSLAPIQPSRSFISWLYMYYNYYWVPRTTSELTKNPKGIFCLHWFWGCLTEHWHHIQKVFKCTISILKCIYWNKSRDPMATTTW